MEPDSRYVSAGTRVVSKQAFDSRDHQTASVITAMEIRHHPQHQEICVGRQPSLVLHLPISLEQTAVEYLR